MTSLEALKRIKRKYKYLIVKEIHRCTHNSNINFGNIEEYWHKENNDDFSQIEKDLELLEIIKKWSFIEESYKEGYGPYTKFQCIIHTIGMKEDFKKIKE